MKVSDLKIGRLYKIRSDRPTNVIVGSNNTLDIHLGHGVFKENSSLVKTSVILYVSRNNGRRWVCYNGIAIHNVQKVKYLMYLQHKINK